LDDPSWGNALYTTHGILGFHSMVSGNPKLVEDFFAYAKPPNNLSVVESYYNATQNLPFGDWITAGVVFQNEDQMFGDHLPGSGSVEPNGDPNEKPVRMKWKC
jgi:hypothetical protein